MGLRQEGAGGRGAAWDVLLLAGGDFHEDGPYVRVQRSGTDCAGVVIIGGLERRPPGSTRVLNLNVPVVRLTPEGTPNCAVDAIVAVDGGLRHAVTLGITPTVVIGDMDSADAGLLARYSHVPTVGGPDDQMVVDTQMALQWVFSHGSAGGRIVIAGALGGRFDHALMNAHLLAYIAEGGFEGVVTDGRQVVVMIDAETGPLSLKGHPGTSVSILPLEPCRGLTLSGLKWPLAKFDLVVGDSITMSNELTEREASIALGQGRALAVLTAP